MDLSCFLDDIWVVSVFCVQLFGFFSSEWWFSYWLPSVCLLAMMRAAAFPGQVILVSELSVSNGLIWFKDYNKGKKKKKKMLHF